MKNITIVTSYFAPAWGYGGPPRVLYTLAKELVRQGKNVVVVTTDALDENRNTVMRERLDGIDVYRFRTISNLLAYKMKLFIPLGILREVKEILEKADIILFSDLRSIINWQLYSYVKRKKIPYGIFPFGEIPHGNGLKSVIKKIFDKLWVEDFVKNASFRFAQTLHEQNIFWEIFNIPIGQTQLLPLPVEMGEFKQDDNLLNEFKKKWEIKDNDKIILFVGRLHFLKGVDILIKTLEPLLKSDQRLKLVVVGRDDGEKKNLQAIIDSDLKKQIIFTGPLYEKDVMSAYITAACFVFTPRYYEETSLAALEALAYGIPVVTTTEADIPYLEEYGAGSVIINRPSLVQQAVTEMLEKITQDREKIQKQAKRLINDHFSSAVVTKQFLTLTKGRYI